jgi:putative PIN family toxin of toxin-antitoxin system
VLDTNVWLDWLVFDDPGVSHLRAAAAASSVTLWIDDACSAELERVLGYPLLGSSLPESEQAAHLATALRIARRYEREGAPPVSPLPACRDPDDQKFLELARDCGAHALLTRDNALLELARNRQRPLPFRVVRPADLAAPAHGDAR